ncbi:hypothetical protein IC575_003093 [Cucumis melo]
MLGYCRIYCLCKKYHIDLAIEREWMNFGSVLTLDQGNQGCQQQRWTCSCLSCWHLLGSFWINQNLQVLLGNSLSIRCLLFSHLCGLWVACNHRVGTPILF